jgi:quercetin dioxygenase-like cupin family protein
MSPQSVPATPSTYTPPGECHWHGAASDHFMTHIAMWEGPGEGQGPETEWGDHVSDEEYQARPTRSG